MKDRRLVVVLIAMFGAFFVLTAAITVYRAHSVHEMATYLGTSIKPSDAEGLRVAVESLAFGAVVEAVFGITALVCALQIYRGSKWASRVWLALISLGAMVSIIFISMEPARWYDHLTLPALCFISWLGLREGGVSGTSAL